ncbi:MAG: hypothetical protein KJP00_03300 [Bacteroidia bacterium]|nr:hypothetical protein [Bacteroidia bacterium]
MEYEDQYKYKTKGAKDRILHIDCAECGTPILAADININNTIAKCHNCNSIFDFQNEIKSWDRNRPEIFMPEGLEVLKLQSELDMQVSWLKTKPKKGFGFLVLFAFLWNLIIIPMVVGGLMAGEISVLLGTSLHLLVGLGLIGYVASIFVNTTDIIVDRHYLEISHRPIKLPFFKKHKIPSKDIKQLYVTRYVASTTNGVQNHAYGLYAILKNEKRVQILKGMNRETQLYIEQEIENYLEIKDKKITGELRT